MNTTTGTYTSISTQRKNKLVSALLDWYGENKRDLPWRKSQHPYSIWISEIMAQQTRITAVLPYYQRFMMLFPTVEALADANTDDVLKAWEGLGYYSRAHNLQKAAKLIVNEFDGQLPDDEKKLRSLPGIGAYTAGAILSISFDRPVPAVDGNVLRVFSRIENNVMDIALPATKAALSVFLGNIMPTKGSGIFSQSLMELGALVCLPKNPNCPQCPVSGLCKAYQKGTQKELPVKSAKKPPKPLDKTIILIQNQKGQILMRQRTEKLLHGLWEFYSVDRKMNCFDVEMYVKELGYTCDSVIFVGESFHVFTHLVWNMGGYECRVREGFAVEGYQFMDRETLNTLAMPTAINYYLNWLTGHQPVQLNIGDGFFE